MPGCSGPRTSAAQAELKRRLPEAEKTRPGCSCCRTAGARGQSPRAHWFRFGLGWARGSARAAQAGGRAGAGHGASQAACHGTGVCQSRLLLDAAGVLRSTQWLLPVTVSVPSHHAHTSKDAILRGGIKHFITENHKKLR